MTAANAQPEPEHETPPPFLIVIIDGDGHHSIKDGDELNARIIDLVMTNDEITFKKSWHGGEGFPRMLILEVS